MQQQRDLELVRLDQAEPRVEQLRPQVLRLRPAPGQRRFVNPVSGTLPGADARPEQVPFAVVCGHQAVGFGILDRGGPMGASAAPGGIADLGGQPGATLLRSFLVSVEWQGNGIARRACRHLPHLARQAAPASTELLLTVNEANPAAYRAYVAGGFTDTGRRYLGGPAGPQHVMRMPLP